MSYVILFLQGCLIGLLIAAPVGPVGILCIRRALQHGWIAGLLAGAGAAVADTFYGAVAAFGIVYVSELIMGHQEIVKLSGGFILLAFGTRMIRKGSLGSCGFSFQSLISAAAPPAREKNETKVMCCGNAEERRSTVSASGTPPAVKETPPGKDAYTGTYRIEKNLATLAKDFAGTFMITLTNPGTIFAFFAIFALFGITDYDDKPVRGSIIVSGVFAGSMAWWTFLSGLIKCYRADIEDNIHHKINFISGIVVAAFGLLALLSLLI